jgi:UDP-N-acetylmuramoylalanine--D-glutamate ligase
MAAYYAAKMRLFMNQAAGDHAVLSQDDPEVAARLSAVRARRHFFSRRDEVENGAFVSGDAIVLRRDGRDRRVMPLAELPLFGVHNQENVLAALLVADLCGVPMSKAADGVRSFRGLPHRLEKVADRAGVAWFNDSKATNVRRRSVAAQPGAAVLIPAADGEARSRT